MQNLGIAVDGEKVPVPPELEKTSSHGSDGCGRKSWDQNERRGSLSQRNSEADSAKIDGLDKEFGRLVVEEGRSRYVSHKFWASLSDEVSPSNEFVIIVMSLPGPLPLTS